MKYHITTLGCQMNTSDTERVIAVMEALGYTAAPTEDAADLVVFNTCSVRQRAEDRVYSRLGELAQGRRNARDSRKRPDHPNHADRKHADWLVAVTGCMVRHSGTRKSGKRKSETRDKLFKYPAVDIAFRIEDVAKLGTLISEVRPHVKLNLEAVGEGGELENYFKIAPKRESKAQVWIPIQKGCDKFCTFCIVPFTRGREQSRDRLDILEECAKAVEVGAKEITLIGQTVDSYGLSVADKMSARFPVKGQVPNVIFTHKIFDDNKNAMASSPDADEREKAERPFVTLLKEIDRLKAKGLRRLRFTSPHPHDFSEDLIRLHRELDTLQPYIHLPVQSGSTKVLRDMRRTYTRDHYLHLVDLIRTHLPAAAISTDIIVGFPGETEEEFEETYAMMEHVRWDMAFLAIYSERPGTYAAEHLPDNVPRKEKSRRYTRLNALLKKISEEKHAAFLDRQVEVLVEKQDGTRCSGRTPQFKQVFFNGARPLIGEIVPVRITKTHDFFLEGKLV